MLLYAVRQFKTLYKLIFCNISMNASFMRIGLYVMNEVNLDSEKKVYKTKIKSKIKH